MASQQHLDMLKQGAVEWKKWRLEQPKEHPDLSDADLHDMDLHGFDLSEANMSNANLIGADLHEINCKGQFLRVLVVVVQISVLLI